MFSALSIIAAFKQKKNTGEIVPLFEITIVDRIKSFFYDVVKPQANPYRIITENGYPLAQERKWEKESEKTMRLYKAGKIKGYTDVDEMFDDILGKDWQNT